MQILPKTLTSSRLWRLKMNVKITMRGWCIASNDTQLGETNFIKVSCSSFRETIPDRINYRVTWRALSTVFFAFLPIFMRVI